MMLKSLILGVLCSMAAFAVKSGIGISCGVSRLPRLWQRVLGLIGFAVSYLLVFGVISVLLQHIDFVQQLPIIHHILQAGMTLHSLLALVMAAWGLYLLQGEKRESLSLPRQAQPPSSTSRGWLLLALPCPLCSMVILFSLALVAGFYPEHLLLIGILCYLAFMGICMVAWIVGNRLQQRAALSPNLFLGSVLLLIACYFVLSASVVPQFSDLDRVYRMASYADPAKISGKSAQGGFSLSGAHITLLTCVCCFLLGLLPRQGILSALTAKWQVRSYRPRIEKTDYL